MMTRKYFILALTFLCMLCGQMSYAFVDENNSGGDIDQWGTPVVDDVGVTIIVHGEPDPPPPIIWETVCFSCECDNSCEPLTPEDLFCMYNPEICYPELLNPPPVNTQPQEQPEPDCTNEIADKIKNVNEPVFKNIIDKFNNPNSPYKVNIFNGPIPGFGSMAQTQPTTVRGTFNIVTNENYTTETSLIATANILHEYIHAYFNTLWLDWKDYGNTHVYDNYPELKNFYMNQSYSGTSEDAHHEQMADSFINNIAEALKELEPGQPDQYYKDIAWATLYNTPVYDADLNETEQKQIKSIRESEVTNTERGGNQPKGKPCNN